MALMEDHLDLVLNVLANIAILPLQKLDCHWVLVSHHIVMELVGDLINVLLRLFSGQRRKGRICIHHVKSHLSLVRLGQVVSLVIARVNYLCE